MSDETDSQDLQLFELQPGKYIDVQINHPVAVRLKLTLIGYEIGRYILIKYPKVVSKSQYSDVLIEGNVVIVRYLLEGSKGECFAFRSTIKNITKYPEKHIYLEYPKKIENRQLRMQQRTTIHLPSVIMLEGADKETNTKINGVIGDISTKGCGFTFVSKSNTTTVKKRDIFVCLKSPTGEDVKIPAKVCNSRNDDGKVNVGIQFVDEGKIVPKLLSQLFIETGES